MNVHQKGFVLPVVLVMVLFVMTLSAIAVRQSMTDGKSSVVGERANALFVQADEPLALMTQDSTIKQLLAPKGVMDKLIWHYEQSQQSQNQQSQSQQSHAINGLICYQSALGMANFQASSLQFGDGVACKQGEIWLWFVLSADGDVATATGDDIAFAHIPSGMSADSIGLMGDDVAMMARYRLKVLALAMHKYNDDTKQCAKNIANAHVCLDKLGVPHKILVQEFVHEYR